MEEITIGNSNRSNSTRKFSNTKQIILKSPVKWYGGKGGSHQRKLLRAILDKIKETQKGIMVDVYGGSAIVALNCDNHIIVYNDKFEGLYNFFCVLRDEVNSNKLIKKLQLSPHCQKDYTYCAHNWTKQIDPVERARCFLVATLQSYGALGSMNPEKSWSKSTNIKDCRNNMPMEVSAWLGKVDKDLPGCVAKLRSLKISNDDALKCIETWDSNDTVFYLDPPYDLDKRPGGLMYSLDYTEEDHKKLVQKLLNIKGSAVLSGYDTELYAELENANWGKELFDNVIMTSGTRKRGDMMRKVQEVLWYKL